MLFDHVRLLLGEDCEPNSTDLRMGNRVIINVGCYILGEGGLIIEEDALIGSNVHVLSAGHAIHGGDAIFARTPLICGSFRIGKGTLIGANCTIFEDACVGNGAVVGAGSVVTKSVPSFAVAVGNPVRIIGHRDGFGPKRWWQIFKRALP